MLLFFESNLLLIKILSLLLFKDSRGWLGEAPLNGSHLLSLSILEEQNHIPHGQGRVLHSTLLPLEVSECHRDNKTSILFVLQFLQMGK